MSDTTGLSACNDSIAIRLILYSNLARNSKMSLVRLAILECDTPIDPVLLKYGRYGDIFEALLKRGLEQTNIGGNQLAIEFSKWDVVKAQQYPEEAEYDALLLSGSSE